MDGLDPRRVDVAWPRLKGHSFPQLLRIPTEQAHPFQGKPSAPGPDLADAG